VVSRIAVALILSFGLLGFAAPAHAAPPLRILLEGDSITQGFHGDYTWRYRLDKELRRQGVAFDFVGSRTRPQIKPGFTTASYADPHFDTNHFAQVGTTLAQHAGWVHGEVGRQDPDLVVIAAGINDIRHGSSPEQVDQSLRAWIANARSAKPTLRIVVSPVLDSTDPAMPWLTDRIHAYNQLAIATAAELSTPESPITVADTTRGWSVTADTGENLHPNPTGETLIAQRIAEHFHDLGILPNQPDIYRPTVWDRHPMIKVRLKGQRAALSWDWQALSSVRVWRHRLGYPAVVTTYRAASATTAPLRPGTYDFRVQFWRYRTSTPYGAITRITVIAKPDAVSNVHITRTGIHWTKAARATSYRVRYKTRGWHTRTTTSPRIHVLRVKRAKVWAVNSSGSSKVTVAHRGP
jgi:hypothetical protein